MSELLEGLSYLGNGGYWAAFAVAVFMAVFVGLLPGVSATLVMALSISFIVLNIDDPLIGIVMLATLTGVDNTLDSIPAVLARSAGRVDPGNLPGREPAGTEGTGRAHARSGLCGLRDGWPRWSARTCYRHPGHQAVHPCLWVPGDRCHGAVRRRDGGRAQFWRDGEGAGGCRLRPAGQYIEQPYEETEDPEARFKDKIRMKAYPCATRAACSTRTSVLSLPRFSLRMTCTWRRATRGRPATHCFRATTRR